MPVQTDWTHNLERPRADLGQPGAFFMGARGKLPLGNSRIESTQCARPFTALLPRPTPQNSAVVHT